MFFLVLFRSIAFASAGLILKTCRETAEFGGDLWRSHKEKIKLDWIFLCHFGGFGFKIGFFTILRKKLSTICVLRLICLLSAFCAVFSPFFFFPSFFFAPFAHRFLGGLGGAKNSPKNPKKPKPKPEKIQKIMPKKSKQKAKKRKIMLGSLPRSRPRL